MDCVNAQSIFCWILRIRCIIICVKKCYTDWRKKMEELYQFIEQKIKHTGYPDDQENGTYVFIVKKSDTLSYKGCMTIMDDQFDLHYVDICDGDEVYHVDFDA